MSTVENNLGIRREVRSEQGFKVYALGNRTTKISVVPELGAKIISLQNLQTGREWMWHPCGGMKLFQNRSGDDFSKSPLVGVDECLPTVAPCSWQGRDLPDHGEVWSAPWTVDAAAWAIGELRTKIELGLSPLHFERAITLTEDEVHLSYFLHNHSHTEEQFLWAIHPLLRLQAGDKLEFPASTRSLLNGATWIDDLDADLPEGDSAKLFASPLSEGVVAINNPGSGDFLEFCWNPSENNTLGLWLTRGGWHGHHHLALEPTNGEPDALAIAASRNRCGVIGAGGSLKWQLRLRLGRQMPSLHR